ncbi:MAG: hypothetical protein MJZ64_05770 [Paludibacteraceae bacterium]|nr:hypothetical protein [Paludibacteraceae bacterium]
MARKLTVEEVFAQWQNLQPISERKQQLASMVRKGYIQRTDTGEWHVLAVNAL